MISARVLSRLLHTLYDAPTSPRVWPYFLREFSQALKLTGAAILYHDMEHAHYNVQFSSDGEAEWMRLYQQHYGELDVWRPAFLKKKEGEFALGDELCPPEEARKTEFYNEFVLKHDIRLFGAVATVKRPKQVEHISLYQSWTGKSPARDTVDAMALVFPHLRSALDLRRNFVDLQAHNSLLESALNHVAAGIILFDSRGNVLLMNRSAEIIVGLADGLSIRGKRLHVARIGEAARLDSLISRAAATGCGRGSLPGGAMLVSRTTRLPITLSISPLLSSATSLPRNGVAIAFIHDPEQQIQPPLDLLERCYHLTPAEARVTLLVVAGHSLKEVAEFCGVTHNTVRSQLKSVFSKTGVQRQAGLILLLRNL